MKKPKNTDEYLDGFSGDVLKKLIRMRAIIRKAAPKSTEVISYGMPAFKQNSVLVFFAAAKEHLGCYPTGSPVGVFKDELKNYKTSKGAIQFPYDKPLPVALITKIVKYRIKEDAEKTKKKSNG